MIDGHLGKRVALDDIDREVQCAVVELELAGNRLVFACPGRETLTQRYARVAERLASATGLLCSADADSAVTARRPVAARPMMVFFRIFGPVEAIMSGDEEGDPVRLRQFCGWRVDEWRERLILP
jgi:hypothetical protein